jgi:predicted DNA-binding transcriptional regulator AlpA
MKPITDLPAVALSDEELKSVLGQVGLPCDRLITYELLHKVGLVHDYGHLRRLKQSYDFPPGRWLGANRRCWLAQDIAQWLHTRSTDEKPELSPARPRRSAAKPTPKSVKRKRHSSNPVKTG